MPKLATSTDRPSPRALVRVWLTGIATWGHRWASALGESPLEDDGSATLAGALWAQELAGYTEQQILDALAHFTEQGHDWPPSLPMVRVQCAGIPSLASVMRELRDNSADRTGFARLVWGYLDTYRLARVDADKHERMIREAYELARENVLAGIEQIPEPSLAIAAPVREHVKAEGIAPATESIEEARRRLFGDAA